MSRSPDPIAILERFFDCDLTSRTLSFFDSVDEDLWIEFAKTYLSEMETTFASRFLGPEETPAVRLYFEPRMSHDWDAAIEARYSKTPILGLSPHPSNGNLGRKEISQLLNPLKKHLLLANSLYIRDSFYYCFDAVADSVDRYSWRHDPNVRNLVSGSIRSIKNWLPILIELRPFIESDALVFTPYYLTPSFPGGSSSPNLEPTLKLVGIKDDPKFEIRNGMRIIKYRGFTEDEVMTAWLNAHIWGLDPVFPNRDMFDWASRLYFTSDPTAEDKMSDLMSVSLLPFDDVPLEDLLKMRSNEQVFGEIQKNVAGCKQHLESMCDQNTDRRLVNSACKHFLQDNLSKYEGRSLFRRMKVIDDDPASFGPVAWAFAIGIATTLIVNPFVGAAAGTIPPLSSYAQARMDPKRLAIGHLTALL